jgi:hypothetical protein
MPEFVERRAHKRPTRVYLLWLDYSVLDVYTDAADAFADAEQFARESPDRFVASRPGRWFGARGRFMEIEQRDVKHVSIYHQLRSA